MGVCVCLRGVFLSFDGVGSTCPRPGSTHSRRLDPPSVFRECRGGRWEVVIVGGCLFLELRIPPYCYAKYAVCQQASMTWPRREQSDQGSNNKEVTTESAIPACRQSTSGGSAQKNLEIDGTDSGHEYVVPIL